MQLETQRRRVLVSERAKALARLTCLLAALIPALLLPQLLAAAWGTPLSENPIGSDTLGRDIATAGTDLSLAKDDGPDPVIAGTYLVYTLTVTNLGPVDALSVTITDTLPSGLQLIYAYPSQGSCDGGKGVVQVICNLGTITNTYSATLQIYTQVYPSTMTTLTNYAVVGSAETDLDIENNTATEKTSVALVADLSIDKVAPASAMPGGPITYTISVSNTGPSNTFGAVVSDTMPDGISGAAWVCSAAGGASCVVDAGLGDIDQAVHLPQGGMITYTVSGTVDPWATETITNTATVAPPADIYDPDPNNNSATVANAPGKAYLPLLLRE